MQEILRVIWGTRQKTRGIICAKGVFHFWENGAIIVTSYRGAVPEKASAGKGFKTVGMSSRLSRIPGLGVQTREIPNF